MLDCGLTDPPMRVLCVVAPHSPGLVPERGPPGQTLNPSIKQPHDTLHVSSNWDSGANRRTWRGTSRFLSVRWVGEVGEVVWWCEASYCLNMMKRGCSRRRCCWSACVLLRSIWQRKPPAERSACLCEFAVHVCVSACVSRCVCHTAVPIFQVLDVWSTVLNIFGFICSEGSLKVACRLKPSICRERCLIWATRLKFLRGIYLEGRGVSTRKERKYSPRPINF